MLHPAKFPAMRAHQILTVILILSFSGASLALVPPPIWYHDGANRFLKLTLADFGKTYVELRTVGAPGEASRWNADGEKKEKEIVFARSVGEDEERGTYYVATATEASFRVKIQPGKEKIMQDEGVVGNYQRLTEDKRLLLAKREFEAAEKRLDATHKLILKTTATADKPVLADIKLRWPALRERILSLRDKPKPAAAASAKPPIGSMGKPAADSPELIPERWHAKTELTGTQIGLVSAALDTKIKDGWDGDYSDGFGGSVNLLMQPDGKLSFTLNCSRGSDAQSGTLAGATLPKSDTKTPGATKVLSAEFVDSNAEVKDAALQSRVRFLRSGHYLIIDTNNAERYSGRGWFDGVYRKQSPPPAE